MSEINSILRNFFFFGLISMPIFAQSNGDEAKYYRLDKSIQVYDRATGRTSNLSPNEGFTFQILGSLGGSYKLKIIDSQGNVRSGDFVSAKSNIDNGFVLADVVEQFDDVIEALDEFEKCDKCDHLKNQITEQSNSPESGGPCDIPGTDADWKRKCNQLYSKGIPKDALDYALKAMKLNATSFRTNKCFDSKGLSEPKHYSMHRLTGDKFENELMRNGLPNKCQMIINNIDDRSPSPQPNGYDNCRGRMYYIDLCQGNDAVVKEDYFNLGVGSCRGKNAFTNRGGQRTTTKGVFFTHTKTFNFNKYNDKYKLARERVVAAGGPHEATSLQVFGLQNTNNLANENKKYIHVSPHKSSFGCPSIAPENYYMIKALADGGPGMILNWSREGMEDLDVCTE